MDMHSGNTPSRPRTSGGTRKGTREKKSKEPKPSLTSLIESKLKELENVAQQEMKAKCEEEEGPSPTDEAEAEFAEKGVQGLHDLLRDESAELRTYERDLALLRKKFDSALKEKEAMTVEIDRHHQSKLKLEQYCRELQRHNKALQDEARHRSQDEFQRRDEITTKLHDSIEDITKKMDKQTEDNKKMAEENLTLAQKLEEMRTQFYEKKAEYQKQLEAKSQEGILLKQRNDAQMRLTEDVGRQVAILQENLSMFTQTEATLKEQIQLYEMRLGEFLDAQEKSKLFLEQTEQQLVRITSGIEELAKARDEANAKAKEAQVQKDKITNEIKELRKTLAAAEKVKTQKESVCRQLQKQRADQKAKQ